MAKGFQLGLLSLEKEKQQYLRMDELLVTATDRFLSYCILNQLPIRFHPSRCEWGREWVKQQLKSPLNVTAQGRL